MRTDSLLAAIGDVLKEERALTQQKIDALAEKMDRDRSPTFMRTVMFGFLKANLNTIDRVCDDILLKKSKALDQGTLPPLVRKAL